MRTVCVKFYDEDVPHSMVVCLKTDHPMMDLFRAFRLLERDYPDCGDTFCMWLIDKGYAEYPESADEEFNFQKALES